MFLFQAEISIQIFLQLLVPKLKNMSKKHLS